MDIWSDLIFLLVSASSGRERVYSLAAIFNYTLTYIRHLTTYVSSTLNSIPDEVETML